MPTNTVAVRLHKRIVDDLRVVAAAHELTIAAVLRLACDDYLRRELPKARAILTERERGG